MASDVGRASSVLEGNTAVNSQHDRISGGEPAVASGAGTGAAAGAQNEKTGSEDGLVGPGKEAPAPALTWKQKVKNHFRRFWWVHVIIAVILLAILLPIIFKVIVPAIVQDIVSKQDLPVKAGALQDLSPNQLSMTLNTTLDTPLAATIEPLQLGLHDGKGDANSKAFVTLNIPQNKVHKNTPILIPNQTATITDMTELITWFNEFFDHPTAKLRVKGTPDVSLSGMHYNANLDKTVEVPGLNYLNGFGLLDMQFILPPDEKGHNMKGTLNIPNSGVLTLGLGNLVFNMMSGDVNLGFTNLYDLVLKPGNNSVYFDGVFYFDQLVPNLATILESQSASLSEGNILLNATGNSTTVNGEHIPYIEGVLNIKHIPLKIPVFTLVADLLGGILHSKGGKDNNLMDIVGDVAGNKTVFQDLLDKWDAKNSTSNKPPKRKRSYDYNLLRLGLRMASKGGGGRWN